MSADPTSNPEAFDPPLTPIQRWPVWAPLVLAQKAILVLCGAILTVLISVQVVTRYIFNESIFGIEELASFVAIWLYFIGGAQGAWDRGHISASLVELVFKSPRIQDAIKALAAALTTVLCAWMTVWAFQYLLWTFKRGTQSLEVGIHMAWVHAVMPLGLALMTVYFLIEAIDDARRALERTPS